MDRCDKVFDVDSSAPGFQRMSSKCQSMAEIPSTEAVRSSSGRNRSCSSNVTVTPDSDDGSREYVSKHKRGRSAEPRLVKETTISDSVEADTDSCSSSTYLVVPRQGRTLKSTPSDNKPSASFVFSHNQKKLSLDKALPTSLQSRDSSSQTPADVQTSATSNITDWPDNSKFQVLESVLQQRSTPGVREGFITPQQTGSVDKVVDSDSTCRAKAIPQKFVSSDDVLDTATNEHLFQVQEEHVAQQRRVSVEREQCITKEKAAMSEVKGSNVPARHHRAVTVSRSQTWSFRDKTKSDQLMRDADTVRTQSVKLGGSSDRLLDETPARGKVLTGSQTLPHKRSSHTDRHSMDETPHSSAVQSCLLRDYDKDKDWSFVPWTDEPGNQ